MSEYTKISIERDGKRATDQTWLVLECGEIWCRESVSPAFAHAIQHLIDNQKDSA